MEILISELHAIVIISLCWFFFFFFTFANEYWRRKRTNLLVQVSVQDLVQVFELFTF